MPFFLNLQYLCSFFVSISNGVRYLTSADLPLFDCCYIDSMAYFFADLTRSILFSAQAAACLSNLTVK